jgi:hypothetical protein
MVNPPWAAASSSACLPVRPPERRPCTTVIVYGARVVALARRLDPLVAKECSNAIWDCVSRRS